MAVAIDIYASAAEKIKYNTLLEKEEIIDLINQATDYEGDTRWKRILKVTMNKIYDGVPYTAENYLEVYSWGMTKVKVAKRSGKVTGGKFYIDCWKLLDPNSLDKANTAGDCFLGSFKLREWLDEAHIIWGHFIGFLLTEALDAMFLIRFKELREYLVSGIERRGDDVAYKYIGWRRYYLNSVVEVERIKQTGFESAMLYHLGFEPRVPQQNLKSYWYS